MPPHEYYICNVSQQPTQQKSTSKRGGLSEVPSLIHNGVLMYMRTVTEPRGTLPSVCAPAGLRRPCAHTSDSRIPIRHHLSNPQKSSIPLQTTPRRCIGTIDIVEPVFGGLGPATYRSAEAPVVSEVRRGASGYVRRVRITDPLPPKVVVHAPDTWQHTYRYTEFPVPPATKKPSFRTSRTSRPHAIMQTRGGARKRVHDSGVQDGPAQAGDPAVGAQAELQANDEHRPDARAPHTNTAPSEQSPKIVNTVTDYPATVHRHYRYRGACVWGAWARNVSIGRGTRRFRSQKRGERIRTPSTNHRPSTAKSGGACTGHVAAHIPLHGIPRPPCNQKTKLPDVSNEPPARDHADARRSTEAGS